MTTDATHLTIREDWEVDGTRGVLIRINRPDLRNPIDHDTVKALLRHLDDAEADPQVRGFLITGEGSAFSAGGDLRKYLDLYRSPVRFGAFLEDFRKLCERLERGPLVTCAVVNGACVAGGIELALACDFLTMAESARIGDGHLGSGQLPGAGGSQRLGRAIGWQKAKEWMLSGRLYSAQEASQVGLTTLIAPLDELEAESVNLVAATGQHSPHAYRTMKQLIDVGRQTQLDEGLRTEITIVHEYATTSHDATEGIHAFLERRRPAYLGLAPVSANEAGPDLTPRTTKGTRTRAVLKGSARTVFGRTGYSSARISDITSEAKLSQGSFYRYFPDKEKVRNELLEDLLRDVAAVARASWSPEEPTRSIWATTVRYLEYYRENADLYALLVESSQSDLDVRQMWLDTRQVFYDRIAHMIRRAQKEGVADPGIDAAFTAALLGGMTEQYAYSNFVEGRQGGLDSDAAADEITRVWSRAIFRSDVAATEPQHD
ncbi:enoyl-CoA hydratase-related protein [Aeromicrobium sp. HA]|uniref:enoyl-CoA hydratase-related protein n=1 Tax=Aeromicrobium sp. HA TaxID=3009077 RepID=UPI0022AE8224|nr:enoyl-CoA hydratase-related protein [Aeromicrobium sp. HA]